MGRKGDAGGSPFSVKSHTIDPAHGSPEEVKACVEMLRRQGVRSVFEAVLNHTALDSDLLKQDPSLYVHTRQRPDNAHGYHHYVHPEKGEFWIRYGGYWNDFIGGRDYWIDTLQLDLSNPRTRQALIEPIKDLVRDYGVQAFRVDMAYQMLNSYLHKNWRGELAVPHPRTEFLEDLIFSVKKEFPHVAFVAEGYSHWDDLSKTGFDLIYGLNDMVRLGGHFHPGWYEAMKTGNVRSIAAALDRNEFLEWQKGGAGMVTFLGTHDNPAPGRAFGEFMWGAAALTILKPGPFLFLGGTGAKFEAPDPKDGKMITFESPVKIDWSGVRSDYGKRLHDLLILRQNIEQKFGPTEFHSLNASMPDAGWVGYYLKRRGDSDDREKVVVIANTRSEPILAKIERPELGLNLEIKLQPAGPGGYEVVHLPGRAG